jgi:hypothetical protein
LDVATIMPLSLSDFKDNSIRYKDLWHKSGIDLHFANEIGNDLTAANPPPGWSGLRPGWSRALIRNEALTLILSKLQVRGFSNPIYATSSRDPGNEVPKAWGLERGSVVSGRWSGVEKERIGGSASQAAERTKQAGQRTPVWVGAL